MGTMKRKTFKIIAALAALTLCTSTGVAVAAVIPAGISGPGLAAVGPTNAIDGFPVWYKDKNGLRLEACLAPLNDPMCPVRDVLPNEALPISFPKNYPGEAFYTISEALMNTRTGKALGAVQLEQAFSADIPQAGDQVTFARVRYIIDAQPNASYTITSPVTPPGGKILVAPADGLIKNTEDIGLGGPVDFSGALGGRIGPFLTWDTYPTDPALKLNALGKAKYIGDPGTPHKVKGSPYNTNFFRIEGPNINPGVTDACPLLAGDQGANCLETDLFSVQGKLATTAGVMAEQATYSRSSTTGGFIDVFASSLPDGQESIQVSDVPVAPAAPTFTPTGLTGSPASAGNYLAHVAYTGAQPPTKVQVSNIGDVPVTNTLINVVDRVSGTAVFTMGTPGSVGPPAVLATPGSLAITAVSSDTVAPPVLTASGFALLPLPLAFGVLKIPGLDAPPVSVTVTSAAGGSVKLPVEIRGFVAPLNTVVAMAGPNQTVSPGQLVTLDGSASSGGVLTFAWTSPAGVALNDPIVAKPTFTAPALPGTYAFDLTVTGPGGPSTATVTVTVVLAVPSAPVIGTVTAGNASATVNWTAPAGVGSPLTGYSVRVVDAAGLPLGVLRPAAAGATSLVVTGLVNGTAVRFQVQAGSAAGAGAFSALSTTVTPVAVPGAPVIRTATVVDTTATVTWTAPAINGGSAITGYSVRVVDAAGLPVGVLRPAAAGATSLVVTGLVNGAVVRFQVQARNAAGTGAFSALSTAVTVVAAVTRTSDFNRDGRTDLVARDSVGQLWLYPGNGTGGFLPRRLMASGWNAFTAIVTPGDVTGDGIGDVLAKTAAGQLRLYPGNGAGGFLVSRLIGASGWNAITAMTAAGDMTGDGRLDVLARDSAGRLWLYPMVGTGTFQPRRLIGASGWNAMTAIMGAGDLSGDRRADLLARDGVGTLWLYRSNGTGGFSARTSAGTGWQGMTALVTPGNWNRTGGNDLIARDGAGTLWLYPGNNAGTFGTRTQIGSGWKGYTIA
jgi:hypothetical protein